jgi:uncharacterized membrane protein YedE/YeeE
MLVRLLVLSATGNLRALLSGLVFAVVAQASLHGFLSPLREALATPLTTLSIGSNDLLVLSSVSGTDRSRPDRPLGACRKLVSGAMAQGRDLENRRILCGWRLHTACLVVHQCDDLDCLRTGSARIAQFHRTIRRYADAVPVVSGSMIDFDVGLVPGVFIGAFLAAWVTGELKLQGFESGGSMRRYLAGAALMGFGGMLAGGCAVGAGVTGASIFALTAWVTLFAIWIAALDHAEPVGKAVGEVEILLDQHDRHLALIAQQRDHPPICWMMLGWMPSVGSSSSSSFGLVISARAMANCCCWPPDRSPPRRLRISLSTGNSS